MCYFFLASCWLFLYNNNQEEGNNANRKRKEKVMKELNEKYQWYAVFAYDCGANKKGEIYSRHTTYELARASAKKSGMDDHIAIKGYTDLLPLGSN